MRVLTPCTQAFMTTAHRTPSMRRCGSSRAGKNEPLPQLRDVQLDVTSLGRQQSAAAAVVMGGALVAALVSGCADRLRRLDLDQLLEDKRHPSAHDVDAGAGADGVEQLRQGRL